MSLTGAANANDVPVSSELVLSALAANDDTEEAAGLDLALGNGGFPSPATTALGD